uniref:Long-chain-fatty-acid--CoA ligase n=1 Tax=Neogobius melanostomus TaxID=47308 RepID=A0A8C6UPY7_9GOBI
MSLQKVRLPDLDEISQYLRSLSIPTLVSVGAVAMATTYFLATRPKSQPPACDLSMQSVEVQGGGLARRSVFADGDEYLTHLYEDAKTVYECMLRGARVSNNGPCLGSRKPKQPYEWLSYNEVIRRSENLGSAFLHKGHSKTTDPYIGIFSQNRPEWTLSELACYTYSLVSVPLYDTLGTEAIAYVIDKASISTIVCDVPEKVDLVLQCLKGKEHSVRTIVLMQTPSDDLVSKGREAQLEITSLQHMEVNPPQPDDLAIICFTSGTTGNPKGAMLTHCNIVSNLSAYIKATTGVMLVHGARIGFFQGDIKLLMDDLATLKPTVFAVVPRLLNRMYDKIFGQASSPVKRWLLGFAYRRKEAEIMKGVVRRDSFWDRLIFSKVQASMGGCVRLMVVGAAPVSPTVLSFIRAAMGCQFYEGYGQTECTAGSTLTMTGDWSAGHVGAPLPCNSVKLVDVPEMNYLAANGEGEICVKGANVFKGYLKDPEKTKETIDDDGWVHTGDIGKWLPNGTLKIVDRKKHIFKLAQGEYIAPEKIENVYVRSDALAQVLFHGDSLQEVKEAILKDMVRLGKEAGLKSFEQVQTIHIHTEQFSIENGLLTPTMKAKRNELRQKFRDQIDELYAQINA